MNARIILGAGVVAVVIATVVALLGPSFNRLFVNDVPVATSSNSSSLFSLSVGRVDVSNSSENSALIRTTFVAQNQASNTALLSDVTYGIYLSNGTRIVFGSIGRQTDDIIQGQGSVFPVLPNNSLTISDQQTVTKGQLSNSTLWREIIGKSAIFTIRGVYSVRENAGLQAQGVQKDFATIYHLGQSGNSSSTPTVGFLKSIPLTGVKGRIDHMSIDVATSRLLIAELGNNSVDIVNLTSSQRMSSIAGASEPQGVLVLPNANTILVSSGGDGSVSIMNGSSLSLIKSIQLGSDADNVRIDRSTGLVYVGYGGGALALLDQNGAHISDIGLPGHPESFQIEELGNRIFVNVPSDNSIVVVDKKTHSVITKWQTSGYAENFPMALDEHDHRLFVGFRDPPKLVIYDTQSGKPFSALDIGNDVDDIYYDNSTNQIYASAGAGVLDVIQQEDADHYTFVKQINTAPGARTSLFVPELHRIYIAAPDSSDQGARLLVYSVS